MTLIPYKYRPGRVLAPFSAKRRALLSGLALLPLTARVAMAKSASIEVVYTERHQVVEGFGTSINTWHSDVAAVYGQDEWASFYLDTLGASALRLELWGGVAPVARQRWQDVSWRDFQFPGGGNRGSIAIDVAKRLHRASRGQLRIVATTWSPPAWMKVNGLLGNGHPNRKNFALDFDDSAGRRGSAPLPGPDRESERSKYVTSNKLRIDRYLHFAKYLVEWVRYLGSMGMPLYALSPANEPRFSHWFESCVYSPDEYAELVETVAWMFANQGEPPIPIFGPEHMTSDIAGNRRYLDALDRRPVALRAVSAIASHGYVDGYRADMRAESTVEFNNLVSASGKKIWVTEGGFGGHDWPAPLHQLGAAFLYALRDGGVSLLTAWQTLTRHPPNEHGLMSLRGPTKKTFVAMHFWRFIRPGMVRIGMPGSFVVDTVAFEDSRAGITVIVLLNRTKSDTRISLKLAQGRQANIDGFFLTDESHDCARIAGPHDTRNIAIPAEAIVTLKLK